MALIHLIAVAAELACEVVRDDLLQCFACTCGLPHEHAVSSGAFDHPEVALFGLSVAGFEILDHRFINLHVTAAHDFGVQPLVDGH